MFLHEYPVQYQYSFGYLWPHQFRGRFLAVAEHPSELRSAWLHVVLVVVGADLLRDNTVTDGAVEGIMIIQWLDANVADCIK